VKSRRVPNLRVAMAVVATGVALTACTPAQAGSAAIVGDERISAARLDTEVREVKAALAEAKVPEAQLQTPLTHAVLIRLVTVSQFAQVGEREGITVTDGEIDAFIARQGGAEQVEQALLAQRTVPPSGARDYLRVVVMAEKLAGKLAGGTDEAAQQRAQAELAKALQNVPVTYSPRYGTFDPQQGFVEAHRFTRPQADGGEPAPQ
jgi:hypothetical protein